MLRPRLLVAAAALGAVAAACSAPRTFRPFAAVVELDGTGGALDAEWCEDFAFVTVELDGRPARRFLLDTGASVVLIAPDTVAELGLPRAPLDPDRGGLRLPGASGSAATVAEVVPLQLLRVGPLRLRGLDALVLDTSALERVLGRRVDGILPAAAFRDATLTIDYPARTVTVAPSPALPPAAAAAHEVALAPDALPQIEVEVGATTVRVLLDSGSSEFLSLPAAAALTFQHGPVETGRWQTIGGPQPIRRGRLDGDLAWAGHTLAAPMVALDQGTRGAAGSGLLRHFRITLDLRHARARFERDESAPVTCPPVRSLGLGFLHDREHWSIAYVLAGGPAAQAGLAAGDIITAIDGQPVPAWDRARFEQAVATHERLRLRVRAAGGEREVDLPVAVLVP